MSWVLDPGSGPASRDVPEGNLRAVDGAAGRSIPAEVSGVSGELRGRARRWTSPRRVFRLPGRVVGCRGVWLDAGEVQALRRHFLEGSAVVGADAARPSGRVEVTFGVVEVIGEVVVMILPH